MNTDGALEMVLFSDQAPRAVARFLTRLHRGVSGLRVRGVLYLKQESGAANPSGLSPSWLRLGSWLLRVIHACPAQPATAEFTLKDLATTCRQLGCSLLAVEDPGAAQAIERLRQLRPQLGVVYGAGELDAALLNLPREGWLGVFPPPPPQGRAAPGSEGSGAEREIALTVRRLGPTGKSGAVLRAATIPRQAFDTPTSLALKVNLLGEDLLVGALADLVCATGKREPEVETSVPAPDRGRQSGGPAQSRAPHEPESAVRPNGPARPVWKLLLRTVLFLPYVVARNWLRRLRGSFPVIILYHHVVTDRPHHLGIPTEKFLRHVEFLRQHYKITSLEEALEALRCGEVKAPTVVLTFDDGYEENFVNLRAVAEATSVPVTLFVCTKLTGTQRPFQHDRRCGQRQFAPLAWKQLQYLRRSGFEIGSHTRTHFDCGSTDRPALESEIAGSKADLEERGLGPVRFFSFPWGHPVNMSAAAMELARSTYPHVFSACGGANFPSKNGDPWHLRRCAHPNDLWELELALQSVLELR